MTLSHPKKNSSVIQLSLRHPKKKEKQKTSHLFDPVTLLSCRRETMYIYTHMRRVSRRKTFVTSLQQKDERLSSQVYNRKTKDFRHKFTTDAAVKNQNKKDFVMLVI